MKVKVVCKGVVGFPISMLPEEQWGLAKVIGGFAYYFSYVCMAENGVGKRIYDRDQIPDGVYELPDRDWEDTDDD